MPASAYNALLCFTGQFPLPEWQTSWDNNKDDIWTLLYRSNNRFLSYCELDIAECDAHFYQNIPYKHHSTIYFHVQNEESHLNIRDYRGKNVTLQMERINSFQDIWNKRSVMLLLQVRSLRNWNTKSTRIGMEVSTL